MFAIRRALLLRRLPLPLPGTLISSLDPNPRVSSLLRHFSSGGGGGKDGDSWSSDWGGSDEPRSGGEVLPGFEWGEVSSWSTGLTKDHFDGAPVGRQVAPVGAPPPPQPRTSAEMAEARAMDEEEEILRMLEKDNKESKAFVDGWGDRMMETCQLLKQVREPGVRGAYLKDSEKAEMYRLHKENPEVYTVERLAMDFRVMRQRVHAILWLKEMEEEEEKKLGRPLDDSVEILLDNFPE